jgi:hypothetical protein
MDFKSLLKESILEEAAAKKEKPSAGLSKKEKSDVVKKAKAGKDIGKKGKGFEKLAKSAGGGEKGEKIAAAAMWKNIKREGSDNEVDYEGHMSKIQLKKIAEYAMKVYGMLEDDSQLDAWVQDHIAKASELMDQVGHFMEEDKADPLIQPVDENLNEGINVIEGIVDMLLAFPLTSWASFTFGKALLAIPKFKDKYNTASSTEEKRDVLMNAIKFVVDPTNMGSYTKKVDEKKLSKAEKAKQEDIVKAMAMKKGGKEKMGPKDYAIATSQAKKSAE